MIVRDKKRYNVDQRKKIKAGYKGKDNLPKRTDYFVVKHPETGEDFFPELIEFYGEKPDKFFITFPSDNLEDFYEDRYVQWGSNGVKKRVCNSVECSFFLDTTISGEKFSAGKDYECVCNKLKLFETKELEKHACRVDMYLKAIILHPETMRPLSPICYLFENHSKNSADNIYSELSRYKRLSGFPFVLTVKMVKGVARTFPIWNVFPHITSDQLINYNLNMQMQIGSGTQNLLPESTDSNDEFIPEEIEYIEVDTDTGEDLTDKPTDNISDEVKKIIQEIKKCQTEKSLDDLRKGFKGKTFNKSETALLKAECDTIRNFIKQEEKNSKGIQTRIDA